MSSDRNDDVQRLLGCFRRGLLPRTSPSAGSRSNSRRQQFLSNDADRPPPSPCTPSRMVREVLNTNENAASEDSIETPPAKAVAQDAKIPRIKKLGTRGRGSEVSPGVFYGSPAGKPAQRPPQLIRLLNEIQNDLASQIRPSTRDAIWATFPRQDQAIQFADSHGNQNLAVFQYQDHINGQRRFLATTYDEFWHRYSKMQSEWRHHYEIIRQGRPCHLYFDLEFNRLANMDANGEAMVDTLLSIISTALLDVFSIQYDSAWTLELDSSTAEKFSRHLIIHIPGAAFKDNLHAGAFVGEICKRSRDLRDTSDDVNKLFVLQGDSRAIHQTELFVDVAVYTRNRSFRLPLSSKAGKTALLLPTSRFKCSNLSDQEIFQESLICKVDEGCQQLLTFSTEETGQGGIVDFKTWKADPISYSGEGISSNYGKSPFPSLEIFIKSIACIGDIQGRIRSWYHFADYGVVVYNISGNRFCEHIGRQHKSNNVMYIVDFRTAGFYQKCHDPDCREYRSPLRPIPRHTIPPEFPLSTASELGETSRAEGTEGEEFAGSSEWEDEAWWGEVVSSIANMECISQVPMSTSQSQTFNSTEDTQKFILEEEIDQRNQQSTDIRDSVLEEDDEWWDAVEREALELESIAAIRKLPAWPS